MASHPAAPAGNQAGVPEPSGTPAQPPAGPPAHPPARPPVEPSVAPVTPDEFFRADIRVGLVLRSEAFPDARKPAYKLWIDFGELGVRTSSAQLTALYEPVDLVGRLVIAVVNFPPRRVAGFSSEVLVLGVPVGNSKTVALIQPDRQVPPGTAIF